CAGRVISSAGSFESRRDTAILMAGHVDDQGGAAGNELAPVTLLISGSAVTRQQRDRRRDVPIRQRNSSRCCGSKSCADTGHNFIFDSGLSKSLYFFTRAAEDQWVPAFQAYDLEP